MSLGSRKRDGTANEMVAMRLLFWLRLSAWPVYPHVHIFPSNLIHRQLVYLPPQFFIQDSSGRPNPQKASQDFLMKTSLLVSALDEMSKAFTFAPKTLTLLLGVSDVDHNINFSIKKQLPRLPNVCLVCRPRSLSNL